MCLGFRVSLRVLSFGLEGLGFRVDLSVESLVRVSLDRSHERGP